MQVNAAVFRQPNAPLEIESVTLDAPGDREVLVRTVATGVCHSDLHVADGSIYVGRRPVVLGHEGAGVVEAVGPAVTAVAVGDHVVGCLSGFCGTCLQCLSGHPNVCTGEATGRPRGAAPRASQDGQAFVAFAGLGSFAERMLVHENSVVKVDDDLPLEVAALVGCGVLTGVGAALRTAAIEAGQTVAVFGCGGVGLSIIQGARLAAASRIIAVDQVDSKLDLALALGATHVVNGAQQDAVAAVRRLAGGAGVDHALEAVGSVALVRQAVESLAVRGTCTIVGVPADGAVFEVPYSALRPECKVQTSRMGSNRFRFDIPLYLDFYRQGRLKLDELVTRRARLEDVNEAFRAMKAGEVARSVLLFD
jgi:S-(hydroxymethyl)glutathione dehydrogenase/alcohol dehydrogenase